MIKFRVVGKPEPKGSKSGRTGRSGRMIEDIFWRLRKAKRNPHTGESRRQAGYDKLC